MNAPARASKTALVVPCCAWVVSVAPFLLSVERLTGFSRTALAALPWIVCAGLPRRRGAEDGVRGALLDVALCVPPIALGTWIDRAAGAAQAHVIAIALESVALVLLLALGARLAAASVATLRWHATAWLTIVAGVPLLHGALVVGGAPAFGAAPAWMSALARASPIAWGIQHLDAGDASARFGWGALLVALVLLAIGALRSRAADAEPDELPGESSDARPDARRDGRGART